MNPSTSLHYYDTQKTTNNFLGCCNTTCIPSCTSVPAAPSSQRLEHFFQVLHNYERTVKELYKYHSSTFMSATELERMDVAVSNYATYLKKIEEHNAVSLKTYQRQYFNAKKMLERMLRDLHRARQNYNLLHGMTNDRRHQKLTQYRGAPNTSRSSA